LDYPEDVNIFHSVTGYPSVLEAHIGYIETQPGALESIEETGLHEAYESHTSRTGLFGSRVSLYAHGESPWLSDKAPLPKKPTLPNYKT
jgi:hypothetical protein